MPDEDQKTGNRAVLDDTALAAAESDGVTSDNDNWATTSEKGLLDQYKSDSDGFYREEKGSRPLGRLKLNRNKKIIGALLGTGAVGIGALGFFGPTLAVNHLRELLLGRVSQPQTNQSLRYRRSKLHKVQDMFSINGRRGSKIIAEMQNRGYRFSFNKSTGQIIGITPPGADSSIIGPAIGEHINDYIEVKHPLRTSRWKTKRMEAFYTRYKVARRAVVTPADADLSDPERLVNKRMAQEILDEDTDIRLDIRDGDQDKDAAEQRREAAAREVAGGDGALGELKQKLLDGVPLSELSEDERLLLQMSSRADQEIFDLLQKAVEGGSIAGKTFNSVRSFGSSTDILDKICTVKNRLTAVSLAARHRRAIGMLRYTTIFVSASDATRGSQVDPKLMNALMKRVTTKDRNGNTIAESPGFAYIMKGKFSKSGADISKSNVGVDGALTGVPGALQQGTNSIPGMSQSQCGVYQNPVFQIGVAAVEIGAAVFSGGTSAAAAKGATITAKEAIKTSLRSILSRQTAKSLTKTALVEMSFEAVLALTQMYVEKSMTLNFTGQERGGELGDVIAGGAGALNKQRSLQAGMVPATAQQYAMAHNEYIALKAEERKGQSFFEKVLDYSNPDSIAYGAATTLSTMPTDPVGLASYAGTGLTHTATALFSNPFGFLPHFGSKAHAQASDEVTHGEYTTKGFAGGSGGVSLATDPAGNLLPILRSDIEAIDPEANIRELAATGDIDRSTLEPISENFREHIKNCVEAIDIISTIEGRDQSNPQYDCLAQQPITVKYKAHLAYLDMVDGIDAHLFPEEIVPGASAPVTPTNVTTIGDKARDTSTMACAPLGLTGESVVAVGDGSIKIKLCDYGGVKGVNASWSNSVSQLLDASKKAGLNLSGGGFRTAEGQIAARKRNCGGSHYAIYEMPPRDCSPPTARPGTSNHELGLAIDFADMCTGRDGATTCPSSPGYNWLVANAHTWGIKKLSSEAWHWSVDGK